MATTADVIRQLNQRGIQLQIVADDSLKVIGADKLTDSEKATLKAHKPALLAHLKAANDTKPPLPDLPCSTCNYGHYWLDSTGWLCGRCHPRTANFAGDSVVVIGGDKADSNSAHMQNLPAAVLGIPIAKIIEAAGDDADLLGDRSLLLTFTQSLLDDGLIQPASDSQPSKLDSSNRAHIHDLPAVVTCGQCQHFIKDDIGDGSGIGQCAIDANHHHDQPLYPTSERRCHGFMRITP